MMMQQRTFNAIRQLVYHQSGIYLGENKMSLVTSRLQKRLRTLGLETYEQYLDQLKTGGGTEEIVELLNAISTNTTYFFREPAHFTLFGEVIRQLAGTGAHRIRVWCAASSTGEEPYSLAMCYREHAGAGAADFKLLATDISTKVLQSAESGIYTKEKLKNIPGDIRFKYFHRGQEQAETYQVKTELRQLITFKRLNLSITPYPLHGPLDVIFCRNVMIYFDRAIKQRFLTEAERLLKPGGYLFIGHAESISGLEGKFRIVKPAVYIRK